MVYKVYYSLVCSFSTVDEIGIVPFTHLLSLAKKCAALSGNLQCSFSDGVVLRRKKTLLLYVYRSICLYNNLLLFYCSSLIFLADSLHFSSRFLHNILFRERYRVRLQSSETTSLQHLFCVMKTISILIHFTR